MRCVCQFYKSAVCGRYIKADLLFTHRFPERATTCRVREGMLDLICTYLWTYYSVTQSQTIN